ncbi:hypothetical protein E5L40_07730 [Helicobacter pylori]|nr:hypothetical protein [Helicobacter pylori]WRA89471.1 hypothetical protein E5L40_07730 [Helicobacter pylori]
MNTHPLQTLRLNYGSKVNSHSFLIQGLVLIIFLGIMQVSFYLIGINLTQTDFSNLSSKFGLNATEPAT